MTLEQQFAEKVEHYQSLANKEMSRLYGNRGVWLHQGDAYEGFAYSIAEEAVVAPNKTQMEFEEDFVRTPALGDFYYNNIDHISKGAEKDLARIKKELPDYYDLEFKGKEKDFFIEFTMLHENVHLRDTGLKSISPEFNMMMVAGKNDWDSFSMNGTFGRLVAELKADTIAMLVMDKNHKDDPEYQSFRQKYAAVRTVESLVSRDRGEAHDFSALYENNLAFLKKLPTPTADNIQNIEKAIEQQALSYIKKHGVSSDYANGREAIEFGMQKGKEYCEAAPETIDKNFSTEQCNAMFGIKNLETGLNTKDQITLNQIPAKPEKEINFQLDSSAFAPVVENNEQKPAPTEPELNAPAMGMKR